MKEYIIIFCTNVLFISTLSEQNYCVSRIEGLEICGYMTCIYESVQFNVYLRQIKYVRQGWGFHLISLSNL